MYARYAAPRASVPFYRDETFDDGFAIDVDDGGSYAEAAGAVGAAVGCVRQRVMITVTQPTEGKFRVHLPQGPADFDILDDALDKAREAAKQLARSRALSAGATAVELEMTEQIKLVPVASNKDMFIEATIQVSAAGAPR